MDTRDLLIAELFEQIEFLSTALDEWFDYSSIARVANNNQCSPEDFDEVFLKHESKRLGYEVREIELYGSDKPNYYFAHQVWEVAYPNFVLP